MYVQETPPAAPQFHWERAEDYVPDEVTWANEKVHDITVQPTTVLMVNSSDAWGKTRKGCIDFGVQRQRQSWQTTKTNRPGFHQGMGALPLLT